MTEESIAKKTKLFEQGTRPEISTEEIANAFGITLEAGEASTDLVSIGIGGVEINSKFIHFEFADDSKVVVGFAKSRSDWFVKSVSDNRRIIMERYDGRDIWQSHFPLFIEEIRMQKLGFLDSYSHQINLSIVRKIAQSSGLFYATRQQIAIPDQELIHNLLKARVNGANTLEVFTLPR